MSLPHALLTALVEHPCSGSELAERFDRSIGYFWNATHQQIYRELARLEEAQWIEALPAESGRGRKRRSEEHTSELQSRQYLVCRLLLEKKKTSEQTSNDPPYTACMSPRYATNALNTPGSLAHSRQFRRNVDPTCSSDYSIASGELS